MSVNLNITYLWLDDVRPTGAGIYELHNFNCRVAHSVNEAKKIIREAEGNGQDRFILELDHDLGEEKTGYDFAKWLIEQSYIGKFRIHSMNPVGANNIRQLLKHYGWTEIF